MAVVGKSKAGPSRAAFLADQLKRAYVSEPWHGQSLKELLAGVTAEQAAAHAVKDGHSIWELVLHLAGWVEIPLRRMDGETINDYTYEQDWPRPAGNDDAAWQATLRRLEDAYVAVAKRVAKMGDAGLDAIIPGKDYTAEFQLLGILQHTAYHAGQIGLLKKAL